MKLRGEGVTGFRLAGAVAFACLAWSAMADGAAGWEVREGEALLRDAEPEVMAERTAGRKRLMSGLGFLLVLCPREQAPDVPPWISMAWKGDGLARWEHDGTGQWAATVYEVDGRLHRMIVEHTPGVEGVETARGVRIADAYARALLLRILTGRTLRVLLPLERAGVVWWKYDLRGSTAAYRRACG